MGLQLDYEGTLEIILDELAKVCTLDRISDDERLGDLVRDSIEAASFMNRVAKKLGLEFSVTLFWECPTAACLAKRLLAKPLYAESSKGDACLRNDPCAIVGLACRFPGAQDATEFWKLLRGGESSVGPVPRDRIEKFKLDIGNPAKPQRGGFLSNVGSFDREIFGLSSHEAANMDPQQQIMLEVAWAALEDAGSDPSKLKGTRGAVFMGAMWIDFAHHLKPSDMTSHSATGLDSSIISARLSYVLGLQGPSLTVNTACSSSLVALHLACQSLRSGECDFALAGGVNLILAEHSTAAMRSFGGLSVSGACHTFDAAADGYVRSEGCGVVVLKPLSAALANADEIYGIVCGTSVNNNGFHTSLTAPSKCAQEAVLSSACERAGMSPCEVQYLEAHGTGTILGDPIEAAAISGAYCKGQQRKSPLIVGSVKANIGHCEAAAGIAGLIKILLSMHHALIPPHINFHVPNPHIDFHSLGIRIPAKITPWLSQEGRRVAGLSSFGFGGTNAHVIISGTWDTKSSGIGTHEENVNRADISFPGARNDDNDARLTAEGVQLKASSIPTTGSYQTVKSQNLEHRGVTLLFSGQGSHWTGMGLELAKIDPAFRATIKNCDHIVRDLAGWSLSASLYSRYQDFSDVRIAWPCHLAIQLGIARTWQAWGVSADAVVGHSIGEVAAAYWSGMLTLEDAFLISLRQAEWAFYQHGAMALIGLSWTKAKDFIDENNFSIHCAIQHHDDATVVCGLTVQLAALQEICSQRSITFVYINTSAAVHRPVSDAQLEALHSTLPAVKAFPARLSFYSGMRGSDPVTASLSEGHWRDILVKPVLWFDTLQNVIQTEGSSFIEIAPHPIVLSTLAHLSECSGKKTVFVTSALRNRSARVVMRESATLLSSHQIDLNYKRIFATNEERDQIRSMNEFDSRNQAQLVVLSARSPEALNLRCAQLTELFNDPEISLQDLSYALAAKSFHHKYRLAFVAENLQSAKEFFLDPRRHAENHTIEYSASQTPQRVGFICLGTPIMSLSEVEELLKLSAFRYRYLACLRFLQDSGLSLEVGPVAAFLQQVSFAALLSEYGVSLEFVYGIEAGEIVAEYLKGALSLPEVNKALRCATDRLEGRSTEPVRNNRNAQITSIEQILHQARINHLKLLFPMALRDVSIATGCASLEVINRILEVWHLPEREGVKKKILSLLGVLYSVGATDNVSKAFETPGCKIVMPEHPWQYSHQSSQGKEYTSLHHASASETTFEQVNQLLKTYTIEWVNVERDSCRTYIDGEELIIFAEPIHESALKTRPCFKKAVWVRRANRYEVVNDRTVLVNPEDKTQFEQLFKEFPRTSVLYLWGLASGATHVPAPDSELERAVLVAAPLHLVQTLLAKSSNVCLWFVTAGCQPAGSLPTCKSMQALLWGFSRTFRLEHPEIPCKIIDVDPLTTEHILLEEAISGIETSLVVNGPAESAWRNNLYYIPHLSEYRQDSKSLDCQQLRSDEGFYLVSGGLGGLGLHLVSWLVERGMKNIAIIGRKIPSESARNKIAMLERRGARVRTFSADIADMVALEKTLKLAECEFGRLRGIIHAAGILKAALIRDVSLEHFTEILRPKVEGAKNLHQITLQRPVEEFILISSASSILGFPRFVSYAAANAYLDALAWERRGMGLPAISIGFGPFSNAGMALLKKGLKNSRALPPLTIEEGTHALEHLRSSALPHHLIMRYDAEAWDAIAMTPKLFALSMDRTAASIALQAQPQDRRAAFVANHICAYVASLLGIERDNIPLMTPVSEFGVDSLLGVEIRNILQRDYGIPLPATLMWSYPTVANLADYIVSCVVPKTKQTSRSQLEGDMACFPIEEPLSAQHVNDAVSDTADISDEQAEEQLIYELQLMAKKFGDGALL